MPKRFRIIESNVVVTPPGGGAYRQDVYIAKDAKLNTYTIIPLSGVLRGYQIDCVVNELLRAKDSGAEVDSLPSVT